MAALKRAFGVVVVLIFYRHTLLGGSVLGDGLGSFGDGVLSQLSGEEKSDSRLDLPRGDGRPLVVVSETGSFGGDPFEDVVNEGVHDGHGFGRDTGVRVNLLQHLVDVDSVGFLSLLLLFLVTSGTGGLGLSRLFRAFGGNFRRHDSDLRIFVQKIFDSFSNFGFLFISEDRIQRNGKFCTFENADCRLTQLGQ